MTALVTLLGPPGVRRTGPGADGPRGARTAGPRGSKVWLLLAYLALAERPVSRTRLAGLLVPDADDPGAALRWQLSQLRRALTGVADIGGDPLTLDLHPGSVVDVRVLATDGPDAVLALPGFGGTLLEGVAPRVAAALELWLAAERERVAGLTAAILHEGAHARLARGDAAGAAALAGRLVAVEPLAERGHELWVRALVAAGDRTGAERRAAQSRGLLIRETGAEPSASLAAALRTGVPPVAAPRVQATPATPATPAVPAVPAIPVPPAPPVPAAPSASLVPPVPVVPAVPPVPPVRPVPPVPSASRARAARSAADVDASVEAGEAAALVGAYERAMELLRAAVAGARLLGDDDRLAAASGALGRVLVHGVRGSDEEAVGVLHATLLAARRSADTAAGDRVAARAALELGHVELLRGRYPRAAAWFGRARRLDGDDPRLRAWVGVFAGMALSDRADYPAALATLAAGTDDAREAGDARAEAYALTTTGRVHVLRDDRRAALEVLDRACARAQDVGATSFLPFPRALRAEVLLRDRDLVGAADLLDGAYALACQVGDPCWEAYALRGQGLLAAARGDEVAALRLLREAPIACRRLRDAHDWVQAHALDALCGFAVPRALPDAAARVAELEGFAARRGMRELVARAALHRAGLGQAAALDHAASLAAGIDNPALARAVAAARRRGRR